MLSNMFDPVSEVELGWESDIRDDVLEECNAFGPVLHIYVDAFSQVSLVKTFFECTKCVLITCCSVFRLCR